MTVPTIKNRVAYTLKYQVIVWKRNGVLATSF